MWQSDHSRSLQTEPTPWSETIDQCPSVPRDRTKKERYRKAGEKEQQQRGGTHAHTLESAHAEGQRFVSLLLWFFTSECCSACSSWRSGGDVATAESSHPRTWLLSASSPAFGLTENRAFMLTCWHALPCSHSSSIYITLKLKHLFNLGTCVGLGTKYQSNIQSFYLCTKSSDQHLIL